MKAEILCVGTEILLGDIINTNAANIAKELANIGINVYYQTVVGDNDGRLKEALDIAFSRADLVITTGGLGPTYDDLTKETVANYFNREMYTDEESLQSMKEFFVRINKPMTKNNEKQAQMPKGAVVFQNKRGTAPGLAVGDGKKTAVLLPGPPKEMMPMLTDSVIPYLLSFTDKILMSKTIHIFNMGESIVEDKLYDLMKNSTNPTIAPYAKMGEVTLRVTALCKTKEEAQKLINPVVENICGILGEGVYGVDCENMQTALVNTLLKKGLRIGVAESCSGGLIAKSITDVPGASGVFDCGVVAYSNIIKQKVLNVREETLLNYGAVSEETAKEMAQGVKALANADIGIATTGIAGPTGGSEEKPVGLVYVGIAYKDEVCALKLTLGGRYSVDERDYIREMTVSHALYGALKLLK